MGPLSSTTRTDINCVSAAVEYVDCLIAEIWKLQLIRYFDEKTIINKYLIWYAQFFYFFPTVYFHDLAQLWGKKHYFVFIFYLKTLIESGQGGVRDLQSPKLKFPQRDGMLLVA